MMENTATQSDYNAIRAKTLANAGAASAVNVNSNVSVWGSALRGIGKITKIAFVAVVGIAALWAGSAIASGVFAAAAPMLTSAGYAGAAGWATWLSGGALSVANAIVAGAAITAGYGAGALAWLSNTAWPAISSGFSGLFASASTTSGAVVAGGAVTTTAATLAALQAKKAGFFATQTLADTSNFIDPGRTQLLAAKKIVIAQSAPHLAQSDTANLSQGFSVNDPNNFSLFSPEGHEIQAAQRALQGHENHHNNHNNILAKKAAIKNAAHHAADQTLETIEHRNKQTSFVDKFTPQTKKSDQDWRSKVDSSRLNERGIDI